MARFVPNKAELNKLKYSPNGMVGTYLKGRAQRLSALAKAQVGVDTGDLKRSIHYKIVRNGNDLIARVGSEDRKALMHHNGTRPHIIRARKAQALRFKQHGKIVYAKVVNHPGTKPNRYLTDNLQKVIDD